VRRETAGLIIFSFISPGPWSSPLSPSEQSRVQDIEALVRHPRNISANGARGKDDVVGRDGDRDAGAGGGVLDEVDARGWGDGIWRRHRRVRKGRRGKKGEERKRQTDKPCTTKPLISSLKRLTSQDTNTPPPPGVMMIVWLPPLSQDPIPAAAAAAVAAVTGRHLMRMESDDNGGSEAEETREALTTPEMGIIFPGNRNERRRGGGSDLFSHLANTRPGLPCQGRGFLLHRSWLRNWSEWLEELTEDLLERMTWDLHLDTHLAKTMESKKAMTWESQLEIQKDEVRDCLWDERLVSLLVFCLGTRLESCIRDKCLGWGRRLSVSPFGRIDLGMQITNCSKSIRGVSELSTSTEWKEPSWWVGLISKIGQTTSLGSQARKGSMK
jgi:hypothetical protein